MGRRTLPGSVHDDALLRPPDSAVAVGAAVQGGRRRARDRGRRYRGDWHQVRKGQRATARGMPGRPAAWSPGQADVARTRTARRLHAAPRYAGREVLRDDGVLANAAGPA